MPEIGPTLREARMRARIDITEVEEATKIRAKYLRAIENEEWGLLPGSTFIKSFIREYAEFLGLDARALVEEYKLRYEHPSDIELRPISPGSGRERRGPGGRGPGGGLPPAVVLGGVLLILVAALWAIGTLGGDGDDDGDAPPAAQTVPEAGRPARRSGDRPARRRRQAPRAPARPARAGVRIVPTADLYVCLVDGDGRVLIPGTIYSAGQEVPLHRADVLRLPLGNGNVQLRANGRPVEIAPSAEAFGYEITPDGVRPLPADALPTCT